MNSIIAFLIIVSIIAGLCASTVLFFALHQKIYLQYREKLEKFEKEKKRIREALENDRKHFEQNS